MTKTTKNKIVYEENINNIKGKAISIVFPDSIQEIANLIKLSNADIVVRGAGTSFNLNTFPNNSVIIDMSKMNKILELDTAKKSVIVEPGVLVSELNEYLEEYGLEFPILPLFSQIETISGMIAKNSSGSREIKYSRMLNWLDYLLILDGNGEEKKISKSDLSDVVGMEGTTGIIIKASLRLTNKKQRSITILKSDKLSEIFEAASRLRIKQDICSIDFLSKEAAHLLGLESKYHIFVEFDTEEGLFKKQDYLKFYKLKNKVYNKIAEQGYYITESIKLFSENIEDFIIFLESRHIPYFGYLTSGIIYPCFRPEQTEKIQETLNFARKLKSKVAYNSGFGLLRKEFLEPSDKDLFRRVKMRYDPQSKLNKNKLLDFKQKIIDIIPEKIEEPMQQEIVDEIVEEQIKEENQEEKIEANKIDINNLNPETTTLKKQDELSPEEKEKIKKIAFGFFGGARKPEENNKQ